MIASFAGGLGLSAMLMPAAPSLALMTFIGALGGTAGRCPDGATGRIVAPAKSRGRNGNLFYVVLCRLAVLTPIGGILPDASGVAGAAQSLLVDWSLRHRAFCSYFGCRNADPAQRKAVGASYRSSEQISMS